MIIPEDYCQVNYRFVGSAAPTGAEVVLGVKNNTLFTDPSTIASAMGNAWEDNILFYQSASISLSSVLVKMGPNATGAFAEVAFGSAGSGDAASVPPNTSVLVKKVTPLGGRQGAGRMFIPGYQEGRVTTDGTIVGADLTNLQTAVDGFLADLVAGDLPPYLLTAEGSPALAPREIINMVVQAKVATQRRRLRR